MVALYSVVATICAVLVIVGFTPPRVTTTLGPLVGSYMTTRGGRTVAAFLGIPYAKPPLGSLRFEPPEPAEPWLQERLADTQPSRCIQGIDINASEDCLFLNIYTPNVNSRPLLPVVVYIFGGVFSFGAISDYTPEFLLDEDIVYVAIQYRVGIFGFFSTGDDVVPGNMALKDILLGLRWIRDNIRSFGGDPDKVTLFGSSSGAMLVHLLMIYAADEGLFRAGICHSGVALSPFSFKTPAVVREGADTLARVTECPADSRALVQCLREKPAHEIFDLYENKYKPEMYPILHPLKKGQVVSVGPVVEAECVLGRVITDNPWHRNCSLPWLVGVNSKELLCLYNDVVMDTTGIITFGVDALFDVLFPKMAYYRHSMTDGSQVSGAVRKFYFDNRPIRRANLDQMIDAASDSQFIYSSYEAVLRANMDQTYMYYFNYIGAYSQFLVPRERRTGACHADELLYFFPRPLMPDNSDFLPTLFVTGPRPEETDADYQMSRTLLGLWSNFITNLDPTPSSDSEVQWRPFSFNQSYLHIKQDSLQMENHFLPERMAFWQSQPYPFRDDDIGNVPCRGDGAATSYSTS